MFTTAACSSSRDGGGSGAGTNASGGSGGATISKSSLIGISMPTKSLERWNRDGANLVQKLKSMGYTKTSLQYADNKTEQQSSQIQNMINQGAKILVIAAVDGTALTPVLQTAANKGVKVIAYDRLINGSKNVDYYATFDNYKVGQLQGNFIKSKIGSTKVNLEAFAGSPDDNNAKFFFSGAWDVLNPLIKSGQITVPSKKAPATNDGWKSIGIQGWTSDAAQSEMQNRLNSFYGGGKKVNVVLSPNDSLALGIAQALAAAGYKPGASYPVLTGQDADLANVKNIIAGKQSMTVWKDTRALGNEVAKMVDQIATGAKVDVNDEKTYNNGIKVVPTYLLAPVVVTKDDIKAKLVDSGFYQASELGL
ncbi:sugar ABC transporter substrate-binding protein [Calidifontibacter sp. DB0510]|uniref:Sugar ABC transporter substrate-binding protein n=2 Tax=Metallococcus carri TaxID=1656884 RepID=A0A967EFM2_9MICO|nr:sugar ABC transporter substrate-binding protein [Metallococcus carri]NOP37862.1 sugar-binding protein [Calidifontibacter sp. DB2511S]